MPYTRGTLTVACVVAAVAGALLLVAGSAGGATAPPALAASYGGTIHNVTYDVPSTFTLTGVSVDAQGNVNGQFTVQPPLYGSGPFTGTFHDGGLAFTITSAQPNPCGCLAIVVTGTADAQGVLSATYTVNTGAAVMQTGTLQATPTAPVPAPAGPVPSLPPAFGASGVFTLPSNHSCVSRRHFRIRIRRQRAGITVISAAVAVNGKRVAVRTGRRLTAPVDLRGMPKGRFTVRISALTSDGRAITGTRQYRTCAPKGSGNGPGPVVLAPRGQ